MALHYPEQLDDKELWHALTVLLAPQPSRDDLLEAMRKGRGYAVQSNRGDGRLRLDRFEVISGDGIARMGQWLSTADVPVINALIGFTGREPPQITIRLISDGEVVASSQGVPPLSLVWSPPVAPPGNKTYCRLLVEGRGHMLFSNPVFIEFPPPPDAGNSR